MPTVNYTKITDRNVSFGLIRTNPKLTSNLKISVDEDGDIWMNSIDANEQLSNQKYKRVPIDPNSNHEANVFKFYDNGKTPSKIAFSIGSSIRTDVMARDLKDQYDFDLYTSGAKYLSSQYPEKFCYFAPLYLEATIPEYFVILRIPGASNYSAGEWSQKLQDPAFNQAEFATDVFRNAKIVKTISLKEDSNIGKYIRRIRQNPMYISNPLYVNFKPNSYSMYRGVSISSGTYVEIPEQLSTVLKKSMGQLQLEKYIIGGFERNNVVHPKILNLEFLFSDSTSEDYSINRYFGFYCNAIDLIKFDLDFNKMYENDSDNETPFSRVYSKFEDLSLTLRNPNGVVLRGVGVQEDIRFLTNALTDSKTLFFPYIKSKDDSLHFIKSKDGSANTVPFSQTLTSIHFSIDDTEFDIGKMFGPNNLISQEQASEIVQDTRSTVLFQVSEMPEHLDTLRIYHQNGSTSDPFDTNGKYDDLIFVKNYFSDSVSYSIDYLNLNKIEFRIPINPNLESARFFPNTPEVENVQYISNEDGSLWRWNGTQYILEEIVSPTFDPIYFYMEGTGNPNSADQVFFPEIEANSTSSVQIDKATLSFIVDDLSIFSVNDRVKLMPDQTRYMIGQITAIDTITSQITVNVTDKKGGGTYSNWRVQKQILGAQFVSTANGSLWQTNGKNFNQINASSRIYINADGNDHAVLIKRLEQALAALQFSHIVTESFENSIFIQSRAFGDTYRSLGIQNRTASDVFLINGKFTADLVWADGGQIGRQTIVPAGNIQRLNSRTEELIIKTYQDWSHIYRVCHSSAFINNGYGAIDRSQIRRYLSNATIMLAEKERSLVDYNKVEIRDVFTPSIGLLSIFEIKDIDFNTYSSSYSKTPEVDLYQYYFIPPNTKILDFQKYAYKILGNGSIEINGITYSTDAETDLIWQPLTGLTSYSVLSGDPVVTYSEKQPGKDYDFIIVPRATSYGAELWNFEGGQDDIRLRFANASQTILRADLIAAQAGYYSYTQDSQGAPIQINLSSATVDGEFILTIGTGLKYEPGQEVKIIESTDDVPTPGTGKYFTGEVIEYSEVSGSMKIRITDLSALLIDPPILTPFVIRTDDLDLFPRYRILMRTTSSSYMVIRTNWINVSSSPGSIVYSSFAAVSVSGQDPGNGPWILYKVVPTLESLRSDIGVQDQDNNLQSFTGFFGLGADHSQPSAASATYEIRDKYLTSSLKSEYEIYLENYSKEFATDNRLVPYISKWGVIDSTDSRGNPYRLNTDIAFGKDNFGPSHREVIPTAEKLTHEWFYIESAFNYKFDPELLRKNYYYFDQPIDVNKVITDSAYFEKYFTYLPIYEGEEIDRPQFRYSKLQRNQYTNQYETIFNGAKFVFSELNEFGNVVPITNRFNDYNFSILLKPVPENIVDPQKPINYRIIENLDAKSILILIEVALSGRNKIGYELLFNSDTLPNARLSQSNLLNALYFTSIDLYSPKIDVLYTTSTDPAYANVALDEFYKFSLEIPDAVSVNNLTGTAIDLRTNQEIPNFKIQPGKTIRVVKGGTTEELIIAMPGSELFELNKRGDLVDICQAAIANTGPSGPTFPTYMVDNQRRLVIDGISYNPIRIFKKENNILGPILINESNELPIRLIIPTWKSMFGDFRLSFNQDQVSNLSYAFLYAVKDKKFNVNQSAFSTVKLAKGVSLSPNGTFSNQQYGEVQYKLESQTLAGLPERTFSLDAFINPISGSSTDGGAFAPIMAINSSGKATLVLSTSAELSLNTLSQNIVDLQNPKITNHAIRSVSANDLVLLKPSEPIADVSNLYEFQSGPSGPVIGPSGPVLVNTSIDYTGQDVFAKFMPSAIASDYAQDDLIYIYNGVSLSQNPRVVLKGRITQISSYYQSSSGVILNPAAKIQIFDQSNLTPASGVGTIVNNQWKTAVVEKIKALGLRVVSRNSLPEIVINNEDFPVSGTSDAQWINGTQQFQLFGGKDYFTNLFENLSFSKFIELISDSSEIVSWETYQNGIKQLRPNLENKFFSIEVEPADQIKKTTIVKPVEQVIETPSKILVGGYEPSEKASSSYEVFRYSGEYEVLFKQISAFKYSNTLGNFDLAGANIRLNSSVSNFFILPELSYVKYSEKTILDLEASSKFDPKYPLIGESPIDYDKFNALSSSWDLGYHYEYSTKRDKIAVAGTKRITEDYSFLSKLINLPTDILVEPSQFIEIPQALFEESDISFSERPVDAVYSVYQNDIRLKINFSRLLSKTILEKGLSSQFNNFFKDQNSNIIQNDSQLIGNLTLEQYKIQYCENNLVRLFQLDAVEFFYSPDYSLSDNTVSFTQIDYAELQSSGYSQVRSIQINNPKSKILTFSIPRNTSSGISIVPKLKIKYI